MEEVGGNNSNHPHYRLPCHITITPHGSCELSNKLLRGWKRRKTTKINRITGSTPKGLQLSYSHRDVVIHGAPFWLQILKQRYHTGLFNPSLDLSLWACTTLSHSQERGWFNDLPFSGLSRVWFCFETYGEPSKSGTTSLGRDDPAIDAGGLSAPVVSVGSYCQNALTGIMLALISPNFPLHFGDHFYGSPPPPGCFRVGWKNLSATI